MSPNPERDARKKDEAGLNAEPKVKAPVAKPDAPAKEGIETAKEKERTKPRQDSLDRERAAGEGMIAPPSER